MYKYEIPCEVIIDGWLVSFVATCRKNFPVGLVIKGKNPAGEERIYTHLSDFKKVSWGKEAAVKVQDYYNAKKEESKEIFHKVAEESKKLLEEKYLPILKEAFEKVGERFEVGLQFDNFGEDCHLACFDHENDLVHYLCDFDGFEGF